MAVAGSLTYDTKIDKSGFEKGLKGLENNTQSAGTKIKNIVAALGITKLISAAFNTINNSLDGAISRVDTLNNFPKVMSNLEISSEESSKAINRLSEGLKGLPTTLDSGALSVQRFTSKNGDVNKSVDLFLALNDAILAGGASSEIQASAIEQISQSYAKGKPDMMEWRSLQTAMPAQIKQIAKAMLGNKEALDKYMKAAEQYSKNNPMSSTGKELVEQMKAVKDGSGDMATALGTALRAGIISMDDFMNTIVELDKNGSEGIKSFAEQAKNSTGGIQTSITNAKTAIVRGVGNIISTVDNALQKTDLKSIGNIISKTGSIAEKALKKIAESISKIDFNQIIKKIESLSTAYIPKLKNILSSTVNILKNVWNWCMKNKAAIEVLTKIIISVIAATKTYNGVLLAIKGINIAKNIIGLVSAFVSLIPSIKGAKDAMLLLNMAFDANPIGLAVSAIAGLTIAMISLKNAQTKEQEQAKEFAESMSSMKKSMEEYNASIDETMNNELSHINEVGSLRGELSRLVDENGKVKEGYESRVSFILNELNNALGTEYKMTGNIIQGYKNLQEEIDETINKKKAEIMLNAEEEKYKEAVEKQSDAVENLSTAQENLNNLLKEKNMTLEELEEKYKDSKSKEADRVHNVINAYNDALDTVKNYTNNIKAYEDDYTLYTEGKYDEIENHITNTTKNWTNNSLEELRNGISEQKEALDTYQQIYTNTGNKIAGEQETQARTNLQNLANELASRTKTIGNLSADETSAWQTLAKASTKIYSQELEKMPEITREKIERATGYVADSSLPEGIAGLGSTGSTKYNAMLNLKKPTDEEITNIANSMRMDTTVKKGAEDLADSAKKGFNNNADGKKWGTDLSENISSGMTSNASRSKLSSAASTVAGIIGVFLKHSVPKKGPLKDELTYMPDMIDNLVMGIDKNKYKVAKAANNVAKDIKRNFELDRLNNDIVYEMNRAISMETGSINAKASVKSNNSMLNVIQATFSVDGSVDIDGRKAGRILAPEVCRTIKVGGLA